MERLVFPDSMRIPTPKLHFLGYLLGAVLLLLYSYTQVDLGLTLSRAGVFLTVQRAFQYIGYFQRPLSANLFIGLVFYYFFLFGCTLYLLHRQALTRASVWLAIFASAGVLLFSYPAFSYDFFNYMFTAKTVLLYHKNPYSVTPLDVSGVDPWLGFMHWTHAVSAYPPAWIAVTLVPYLLGFGYFLLILFNIKFLLIGCYLLSAVCLEKILIRTDRRNALVGLALFALNPLVIVEVLVSGHNDILLILFALAAYYYYLLGKRTVSFLMLALSIAFKTSTATLLPLYITGWTRRLFLLLVLLSVVIVSAAAKYTGRDIQPWYFLILIAVTSLFPHWRSLQIITAGASVGLLLQYAPFLYFGNWDPPVGQFRMWAVALPAAVSVIIAIGSLVREKQKLQGL